MSDRYVTPLDPDIAAQVATLNEDLRERFEEAAGVYEHMQTGVSRRQAEALAWRDILDWQARRRAADVAPKDPDGSAA